MYFDGTETVAIDSRGDLVLQTVLGELRQHAPRIYQWRNGVRPEIAGGYVKADTRLVRFQVEPFDSTQTLFLDPTLDYATFLGGVTNESARGIAADSVGNVYVVGFTNSIQFPGAAGGFQKVYQGGSDQQTTGDAFVTKIDPTGSSIVYSTYLGGSADDIGLGIALDKSRNVYITGYTNSANFPTTSGAFQTIYLFSDQADHHFLPR